jgi:hypothetical protein
MHSSLHVQLLGTALGAGIAVYVTQRKRVVHAFWTTNSDPEVKWDHNWDRYDYISVIRIGLVYLKGCFMPEALGHVIKKYPCTG